MFELIPRGHREDAAWPLRLHRDFRREMDDLIGRFLGEEPFVKGLLSTFSPAIDVSETDEAFLVRAEIPGIDPKDLDINLTGEVLTIKGEKKKETEEEEKGVHRLERSFGSFTRSFSLPCEVQEDKIQADFENGVVTLKLPKAESAKKKSLKINVK